MLKLDKSVLDVDKFKRIQSGEDFSEIRSGNTDNEYINEMIQRDKKLLINSDKPVFNEEADKPKTFIREYLIEERERQKSLHLKKIEFKKETQLMDKKPKKRSQKGRCYTCFPRKKVVEHIIQVDNGIVFHHDMCNRNMIIVTPEKHYSNFSEISPEDIGIIFKEIDKFCTSWNIEDYNVNYNQGEWQTHKHFHLKIKSYDSIIKRMRGDHFRLVALQKIYNVTEAQNAVQ